MLFNKTTKKGYLYLQMLLEIKQLEFETSCKFTHVLQQNQSIETPATQGIEVIKDGPVLDKLQSYLKRNPESKYDKKISASAFTDYIACPLKFFFGKIAGLAEPKDMPDEIGPHTVGTMLHSVMESFYHDSLGKEVTAEYIRQREKLLPAMSKAAMIKELKLNPDYELQQSALQQIVIRVIEQYALKVLRFLLIHAQRVTPMFPNPWLSPEFVFIRLTTVLSNLYLIVT